MKIIYLSFSTLLFKVEAKKASPILSSRITWSLTLMPVYCLRTVASGDLARVVNICMHAAALIVQYRIRAARRK